MDITYRRGTIQDSHSLYSVLAQSLCDFDRRTGTPDHENGWNDPAVVAELWESLQPLYLHLATTADQYWVAQQENQIIGYARSILGNDIRVLTEFFVLPAHQSGGVGRALFARAFPVDGVRRRVINATTNIGARALYLKSGVYARFPIQYLSREPALTRVATDLVFVPASATPQTLAALRAIDTAVLDFERDAEHQFLLDTRNAYLYYRGADVVGYGYISNGIGPVALLDESDYPAVLAHAENAAVERGDKQISVEVPLINRAAVDYLLARKFQLGRGVILFMSNEAFGRFENYIISSPPLLL